MSKKQKQTAKKLHTFFYNNSIYIIDPSKLEYTKRELNIDTDNLKALNKTLSILKRNKISLKTFLQKISACWITN